MTTVPLAIFAASLLLHSAAGAVANVTAGEIRLTMIDCSQCQFPAAFATDPKVKEALSSAIADTLTGVKTEYITITGIKVDGERRLFDSRRLPAFTFATVAFSINLPGTYTGATITKATIDAAGIDDATDLKTNIIKNFKAKSSAVVGDEGGVLHITPIRECGCAISLSAVEVKEVTTMAATTPTAVSSSVHRLSAPAVTVTLLSVVGASSVLSAF